MKKCAFVIGLFLLEIFLANNIVNAEENVFYQNSYGVILNKSEYDFFTKMYWDGYQEYLSSHDYELLKEQSVFDKMIEKKEIIIDDVPISRGSSVTANSRKTVISKTCSTNCVLSLVTTWQSTPYIKSFDVVGVRVANSNILSIGSALVSGNNYSKTYSNSQSFNNGFGFSVSVPNTSNIKTTLTFVTNKNGTAYGTYQHAMSNVSEQVSKQYTIGSGGFGNVFLFNGNARTVYDNAVGVDITLN